jgi:hypothetical protein
MMEKNLKQAQKIARASIYDDAKYIGKWNGYEVYEPIFTDDKEHYIGFPQYILVKGETLRWTKDHTESIAIMDVFYTNT